jgi:alkylhydroperoxidase family enzyme
MTSSDKSQLTARLPYLSAEDLTETDRDVLEREINLFRILAYSPLAARRFNGVGHFIRHESELSPKLRQLAILQVGFTTRSPYEWSHHIKISRDFGVTDAEIAAVVQESQGHASELAPLERDVLTAAREITLTREISDDLFARLTAALKPQEVIDLVVTISFYNAVVRVLGTLRIDVEPEYLRYLEEFPLPAH